MSPKGRILGRAFSRQIATLKRLKPTATLFKCIWINKARVSNSQMSSPAHPIVIYDEDSTLESEDAFLGFVNHARSVLSSEESMDSDREEDNRQPSWSWIVSRILKTCIAYSSGVTAAILLSDLFQAISFSFSLDRIPAICLILRVPDSFS